MELNEAIELIEKSIQCEDRNICGITEDCDECPYYVPRDIMNEAHKVILNNIK